MPYHCGSYLSDTRLCASVLLNVLLTAKLEIILSLPILLPNPSVNNQLYVSNFPRERDAVIVIELSINLQHRLESIRKANEEGPPRSSPRIAASDLQFP